MKYGKILLITLIILGAECPQGRMLSAKWKQTTNSAFSIRGGGHSVLTSTEFIPDTLNFGPVILFDSKKMGFTLKNTGTDTIFVVHYTNQNSVEFTVTGPTRYFLSPDSSQVYSVTFSPQSHQAIHTDSVTFTFSDSTTATLHCIGYDHLPIHDTLAISRDYLVYADSEVTVSQVLTASLADALDSVRFFAEYINYDPALLDIGSVTNGALTPSPDWTINTVTTVLGVIQVTATGTGYSLQGPGEILRLQFHVKNSAQEFQTSTVWDSGAIFNASPLEPLLSTDTGLVRVIDTCTVQIANNVKPASGIEQNFPNPASTRTTIPYSIGESNQSDSTSQQLAIPVGIFLYDPIGNLLRVLIQADMLSGRHEVETDVSGLSQGLYWYEFRAGSTHEVRPLVVAR